MTSRRWWVIALAAAACGNSKAGSGPQPGVDGGAGSAGADAAMPDAPPDHIDVTVLPDFLNDPVANLPVVFSASDGTVLGVETTDATGHASHMVTAATSVTVIRPSGNQGTVTIAGVAPGTSLRFGALWMQYPTAATMNVSWPAGVANAFYDVETRCGGFGSYYQETSGSLVLDSRCTGTFDATIAQYYNDRVQSYLTLTGQTPTDGGSLAFTGTWQPAQQLTGSFTGLPANSNLDGVLTESYDGYRYFDASQSMDYYSTDGTGVLPYTLPPAPGAELDEEVTVNINYGAESQVVGRRLAYTDPVGFDLSSALVPSITNVSYDAASNTVHWTTDAGAAPQIIRAELHYPGTTNSYPTWVVVAPGDATSVTPPQLPDSLAMYRITGAVQGALSLVHVAKSYGDVVGDVDLWVGRSNITTGMVDWQGTPSDVTSYTAAVATF